MKSYLRHKIFNLIDIKALTAVEYLDFEGKYKNYVEKHNFWEFCFVEKGDIKLTIENNLQIIEKNSFILIPPDKKHSYSFGKCKENKVFVICFQCFSQAIIPLAETKFDLISENYDYMQKIIAESLATFQMNENDLLEVKQNPVIGGQQMIIMHLECLLINVLRLLASKEKSEVIFLNEDRFYEKLVDEMISYLKYNIGQKLTLDEICDKFIFVKITFDW